MRALTRHERRIAMVGLVAVVLFGAFVGLRLHQRANVPNPMPSAEREATSRAQPQHQHPRRQTRADDTTSPTEATRVRLPGAAGGPGRSFAFGPRPRSFVTTISGQGSLKAIGYKDLNGTKYLRHHPAMPFVQRATIQAPGLHVIVAAQIGPQGGTATCTITVNGKTAVSRTVHGPYQVVVCSA